MIRKAKKRDIPTIIELLQNIKTLYIDDICVDEKARGQHVGKALYLL